MTIDYADPLERELALLTTPAAQMGDLWSRALASTLPRRTGWRGALGKPIGTWAASLAACLLVALIVGVAVLPSLGKARASARQVSAPASSPARDYAKASELDTGGVLKSDAGFAGGPEYKRRESQGAKPGAYGAVLDPGEPPASARASPIERRVIRKANIDLQAPDVRGAFMKATMLLSEARGEYVEESTVTGQEPNLYASLKLRVAADRMGAVLIQLRELGKVQSETTSGEDVTDQVVDVESRLRNEQRVEAEMLQLLEGRKNADLKEILQLRESIAQVRESIERLTAQRDRLGRLVSLGTILVTIRAGEAPAPVQPGAWSYFVTRVSDSWASAVRTLADSALWLMRVVVGGLIWWLLLAGLIVAIRTMARRMKRAAAEEPAPALKA